jgi:hypothetical protein
VPSGLRGLNMLYCGMVAAADRVSKEHIDGKAPNGFDGEVITYGEDTLNDVQFKIKSKVRISCNICKAQLGCIID